MKRFEVAAGIHGLLALDRVDLDAEEGETVVYKVFHVGGVFRREAVGRQPGIECTEGVGSLYLDRLNVVRADLNFLAEFDPICRRPGAGGEQWRKQPELGRRSHLRQGPVEGLFEDIAISYRVALRFVRHRDDPGEFSWSGFAADLIVDAQDHVLHPVVVKDHRFLGVLANRPFVVARQHAAGKNLMKHGGGDRQTGEFFHSVSFHVSFSFRHFAERQPRMLIEVRRTIKVFLRKIFILY